MHALDFINCSQGISGVNGGAPYCPNSCRARPKRGVNYLNTSTSKPSDSFPGLMALDDRRLSAHFGAFYDVGLRPFARSARQDHGQRRGRRSRRLYARRSPTGTTTEYDEGNRHRSDAAQRRSSGRRRWRHSFDRSRPDCLAIPLTAALRFIPWNFVRTNTDFGVIHAAGGYTAWSDKHPSYSVGIRSGQRHEHRRLLRAGHQLDSGGPPRHPGLQPASGSDGRRGVECLDRQLPEYPVLRHAQGQRRTQRNQRQDPQRQVAGAAAEHSRNELPDGQRRSETDRKAAVTDGRLRGRAGNPDAIAV